MASGKWHLQLIEGAAAAGKLAATEQRCRELEAASKVAKAASQAATDALARVERKADLMSKERDGLKKLLASYNAEDAAQALETGAEPLLVK